MQPFIKTFKGGTHLFRENDHSRELYIIQEGEVEVYRKIGSHEVQLALLNKGAVLGEMALIDGKPRSASAKTVTDAAVIIIDADTFFDKIKGVPSWFMSIITSTSLKIRKANLRLQNCYDEFQEAKIIVLIYYFFQRYGGGEPIKKLDLQKTKTQLIQLLGITHQKLARVLDFLSKHKLIELLENSITLPDPDSLKAYCKFIKLWIKKNYDKMPDCSDSAKKFFAALARRFPALLGNPEQQTEIPGEEIASLATSAELTDRLDELVEQFKEWEIIKLRKEDAGAAASTPKDDKKTQKPYCGTVFLFDKEHWTKWYYYSRFSNMVPLL